MEEKYKLNILKDILKFSGKVLSKEEMDELLSSPLFKNKNYFTSAALLVKRTAINIAEFLSLSKLSKEELSEFLEPVDDDYDYFKKVTPEEILEAFKEMEKFIANNQEKAMANKEKSQKRLAKIKEFYQCHCENIKRGA